MKIGDEPPGGEKPTFDLFVAGHRDQLRRHLRRSTRGLTSHEIEDVVQETFVRLIPCYAARATADAAYAYACQIAMNVVCDTFRRARLRSDDVWLESVHRRYTSSAPIDPLTAVLDADRATAIRRALRRLPAGQRRAIELVHLRDLTPAQAAASMGVGRGTVKGLLQRGRARLRSDLPTDVRIAPGMAAIGKVVHRRMWIAGLAGAPMVVALGAFCLTIVHTPAIPQRLPFAELVTTTQTDVIDQPIVAILAAGRPASRSKASSRRDSARVPTSTARPPVLATPPVPVGACAGRTCVGLTDGDNLCVTDQQGQPLGCAKQAAIAVCEHVPDQPVVAPAQPRLTCEREGAPEWVVPPPP